MTGHSPPDGFFYDDLVVGMQFPVPASITITSGIVATYHAITGDALPLSLDRELCEAVTGSTAALVNPLLTMHLSIGASTVATRNVLANLFYVNVVFGRPVFEGETLRTGTRVDAMADARPKPDTRPRGKVLLGISTSSAGSDVLAYQRCPLLPCRDLGLPGRADSIAPVELGLSNLEAAVPAEWDLSEITPSASWPVGVTFVDPLRDVIDQATSLVRLTRNLAAVHRDANVSSYRERLVYGGHPVSLAQASLIRMMPGIVTILGWLECSHTAPVFEGDILQSRHTLLAEQPVASGRMCVVRTVVVAQRAGDEPRDVLNWRYVIYTSSPEPEIVREGSDGAAAIEAGNSTRTRTSSNGSAASDLSATSHADHESRRS